MTCTAYDTAYEAWDDEQIWREYCEDCEYDPYDDPMWEDDPAYWD